jgi:hypothetical protein
VAAQIKNMEIDNTFIGRKVIIEFMDDEQAVPEGTIGVIQKVDDLGQIHVNWANGSTLAIVPEKDKFRLL